MLAETNVAQGEPAATIKINVKTLDSRVHSFSVAPNITVPELKAKISDSTNVPPEAQRLIFHGKVLKDDKTIQDYSIQDGQVLHMVERPPNVPPPQSSTASTMGPSTSSARAPVPAPVPQNFVMGAVTIPVGSDTSNLNNLLSNVLSSLGVPLGSSASVRLATTNYASSEQSSQPSQSQGQQVSSQLLAVEQLSPSVRVAVDRLLSVQITGSGTEGSASTSAATNAVERTGVQVLQLASWLQRCYPHLLQLGALLSRESSIEDQSDREEAQQLLQAVAPLLQPLGSLLLLLSPLLSSTQMGESRGSARQLQLPNTTPVSVRFGTGSAPARSTVATASSTGSSRTPNTAQASGVANLFSNLMPMVTPILQQLSQNIQQTHSSQQPQQPSPSGAQGTTSTSPPADFNNLMGSVFHSFGTPSRSSPTSGTPTNTASQGTNTSASPFDLNAMMSQVFSSLASRPSAASVPPAQATSSPASGDAPLSQPAATARMFQILTQAMGNVSDSTQSPSVSDVIASLAQTMEAQGTSSPVQTDVMEGSDALGEIFHLVMSELSVPDLLSLLQGNWAPMGPLQRTLSNYLQTEVGLSSNSPDRIKSFAQEIVKSLSESLDENNLPEEIKGRIVEGGNITEAALTVVHSHTYRLLELILASSEERFAMDLKAWSRDFVQELVQSLSLNFRGGLSDTAFFVQWFLQTRLAFMGDEVARLGSNLIAVHVMNTFSAGHTSSSAATVSSVPRDNGRGAPLITIPTLDLASAQRSPGHIPPDWLRMIQEDEQRQSHRLPQSTHLSAAYQKGNPHLRGGHHAKPQH
ncbi:Ubiquitin-like protein Nedd8 [Balamuthia mandrillaris]